MADRGAQLFSLVEAYAALGDHRTGTAVDDATRQWFGAELSARGASVEELAYHFDRYAATSCVTVRGHEVESLPVFYSGLGEVDTEEPFTDAIDISRGFAPHLDDVLAEARASGHRALVLATLGAEGRLVAPNRAPADPPGPIAVLVAGRELDALRAGPVRVTVDARIAGGRSASVAGRLGAAGEAPVIVTTPLTGWFACAGERGTGAAIALALAEDLAEHVPVLVVGTTGHEIGHLGAQDYTARAEARPRAVVHLGASVAAGDVGGALGDTRFALVDGVDDERQGRISEALARARYRVAAGRTRWPGEGESWRGLGVPVLSLVGGFDRFHTPDDLPEVTSPELLETATAAVVDAAGALCD